MSVQLSAFCGQPVGLPRTRADRVVSMFMRSAGGSFRSMGPAAAFVCFWV